MAKIIKVSDWWDDEDIELLIDEMQMRNMDAIVVRDSELEVYDGNLESIDIENGEDVLNERFSGSLLGYKNE